MITLTRFHGDRFSVNPDMIVRADATPDTVITLIDGTKAIVAESLDEAQRHRPHAPVVHRRPGDRYRGYG
ncbi:flagellar FlbD family protein [Demequina litorisediminis]|uniref:flagellar FlbD family protein n=1 Tax=Demequina litorisediminis TaxID=1849022 RepID=UPI003D66AB41